MPQPTLLQQRAMEIPLTSDALLVGGRGGGKTHALFWLMVRDSEIQKQDYRCLFLRASFPSLSEVILQLRTFIPLLLPGSTYNSTTTTWTLSNGGIIELGYLDSARSFERYLGRSYSCLIIDEISLHPTPEYIDLLRSCLRAPPSVPTRMLAACNPGFAGSLWLRQRYVIPAGNLYSLVPSYFLCEATGRWTTVITSTLTDNPHIDREEYEKEIRIAAGCDTGRLAAWLNGDWSADVSGSLYADVFSNKRSLVQYDSVPSGDLGRLLCVGDFGTYSPTALYLGWVDNFTKDITLLTELYTAARGRDGRPDYSRGVNQTIDDLPLMIGEWLEQWQIRLSDITIYLDNSANTDANGLGTAITAMRKRGLRVKPINAAIKHRAEGAQHLRRRLQRAGRGDGGLYWTKYCPALMDTLALIERDEREPEAPKKMPFDHAGDAVRYLVMMVDSKMQQGQANYRMW
jgi:hypothetical protein